MEDQAKPVVQGGKSKEQALAACVEDHKALVKCFKTCSFIASFTGCCTAEHKVFWACYTAQRGTNETVIKSWMDDKFGGKRDNNNDDASYMPCSAEWFMERSSLCARHHHDNSVEMLVAQGGIAGSVLLEFQSTYQDKAFLWMELNPRARTGQPVEMLNDIPVYANVKIVVSPSDPSQLIALEINYITLFAYNGHYTVAGIIQTGAHDGDIEHCTARVHPTTGNLLAMWYNSHRGRDGEWVPAEQVPKTDTGRTIAYIALHGHGNYPREGTILRHFFLGNDRCSSDGPIWRPRRIVLLPNHSASDPINEHVDPACAGEDIVVADGKRILHICRSRGSSMQEEAAAAAIEAVALVDTLEQHHSENNNEDGVDVVTDDPCDWLYFTGDWGTTTAPIGQRWLHDAETPVSRTSLQRIFFHLWPETESLE